MRTIIHPAQQLLGGRMRVEALNYGDYPNLTMQITPELPGLINANDNQDPVRIGNAIEDLIRQTGISAMIDAKWFTGLRDGQQFENPVAIAQELRRRGLVDWVQWNFQEGAGQSLAEATEEARTLANGRYRDSPQGRVLRVVATTTPLDRLDPWSPLRFDLEMLPKIAKQVDRHGYRNAMRRLIEQARIVARR